MIEFFKIVKAIYDSNSVPHFDFVELSSGLIRTRGNDKLAQHHCQYDLKKYNFINRMIPVWNSLSNYIVSVGTVNTFESRLDKFWLNQDMLYNYKADLHGTINCSICV